MAIDSSEASSLRSCSNLGSAIGPKFTRTPFRVTCQVQCPLLKTAISSLYRNQGKAESANILDIDVKLCELLLCISSFSLLFHANSLCPA